jgi:glycosyltransferase involved in cell wall biosynthesis
VRQPENRGKGAAVRRGLEVATGELIGYIDADDKTDISALDQVTEAVAAGADIVIGDRTLSASDIQVPRRRYRQWGSEQFRRLLRWWMGLGEYPDTQCGFKFFRGAVMHDLFRSVQTDGYMFDVEILLLADRAGYTVRRIPVRWRDDPDSRFHPLWGSLRNLRELARIRRTHR